jgi:hypothetical protein
MSWGQCNSHPSIVCCSSLATCCARASRPGKSFACFAACAKHSDRAVPCSRLSTERHVVRCPCPCRFRVMSCRAREKAHQRSLFPPCSALRAHGCATEQLNSVDLVELRRWFIAATGECARACVGVSLQLAQGSRDELYSLSCTRECELNSVSGMGCMHCTPFSSEPR